MKIEAFKDATVSRGATIAAAAEEIGALILGVEGMLASQRQMMAEANVSKYLQETELWAGVEVLLVIMKRTADDIEKAGTAIQEDGAATKLPAEAAAS